MLLFQLLVDLGVAEDRGVAVDPRDVFHSLENLAHDRIRDVRRNHPDEIGQALRPPIALCRMSVVHFVDNLEVRLADPGVNFRRFGIFLSTGILL